MSKTILLADDSVTIRKVVELTFMEEDYQLVSMGSGEEAIDQLREVGADLVIADVHMPGVNGYEVCRMAKQQQPERPVLLLVGTFEPIDAAELQASGADARLKKPFDSQELLQTVRELLGDAGESAADSLAEARDEDEDTVQDAPAVGVDPAVAGVFDAGPAAAAVDATLTEAAEMEAEAEGGSEGGSDLESGAEVDAGPTAVDEPTAEAVPSNGGGEISDEAVERIARRVAELLGPEAVREVAWEVVPDLAEVVIKERLRELESQVE